ncbi:MAG: hypothetical protein K1Y36_01830 [Blastocatellia bacterium]|nr:hypothetical protein [Blastocatellia bacterium]
MTNRKRITQTRIETHEVIRIHLNAGSSPIWCPVCRKEVLGLLPYQVAVIRSVTMAEVQHQIMTGELHTMELESGELVVCPDVLHNKETRRISLPIQTT